MPSSDVASRIEANPRNGIFSMGAHTHPVPMELFATNRRRLVSALKQTMGVPKNAIVLLMGGGEQGNCKGDSSDMAPVFRQESFFHWAFGVLEPDNYGAVDVETGESTIFIPKLPAEYAVWMGHIPTLEETKEKYRVDTVKYTEDMGVYLRRNCNSPTLLVLDGENTDSGKRTHTATFEGISEFNVDHSLLYPVICECRVIKTEMELDALRYATRISCDAHKVVMRTIKPGQKEYHSEATFMKHCYYYGGCRHVGYNCIAGCGHSGSTLHYGHAGRPNDQTIKDGDMALFDMGGEYYRFCSDVTCSFPVNGKFTDKQKVIYNAVQRAVLAVRDQARPGVSWLDMHLLSNREMLEDLKAGGLLKGNIDDMMKVNLVGRVFQPCGLGHFIGNDVHDVGGYLPGHPERPEGSGLKSLRTTRILKPNMAITIESGCYFIDHLLDEALENPELSPFLVSNKIEEYRGFGGCRIEDDVIVKQDGPVEVMSVVPRTVEEIEEWMAGEGIEDVESVIRFKKLNQV